MLPYIATLIIVLVLDFFWLNLNKSHYYSVVTKIQGSPLRINYTGAIVSYILLILGIFMFSIPMIKNKLSSKPNISTLLRLSFVYGGLLGIIVYGVFNATNIAIFRNYTIYIALKDTLWGCILYTIACFTYLLSSRLQ